MCGRRGSMCGRATAPMWCKWASLASHYRWWQLTNDSLHDCAWATWQVVGDRLWCGHDTSTSDQFCHGKTWQYPWKSVDIATSKCFFSHGNNSFAIETTPNLRCKSDNVLYFFRCLSCRYIHTCPSLYPRLSISVSTLSRRCIHAEPSLYPRLWNF